MNSKPNILPFSFFLRICAHVFLLLILSGLTLSGCSTYNTGGATIQNQTPEQTLTGRFALSQMVIPPVDIQSLELHPSGNKTGPPIIQLGKTTLTIEFDYLGSGIQQFTISVEHRGKNWEPSPIGPTVYMEGFFETSFTGGQKSFVQNPGYFHYSYGFPNERIDITKSGNYLLSISDYNTNELLFRIPFFITENTGRLQTRIESLFTQRPDGRTVAQPFSTFQYPDFVNQPQFDLSFRYVQNRFWGRAEPTDLFDTATPGEVNFHLSREQSFLADYEFNVLDVRSFAPNGRQIIEQQPGQTPPVITLRRDIQQFNQTVSSYPGAVAGLPRDDRQAQYGDIRFSLETDNSINPTDDIYLVGDFNNWVINPQYRMQYNKAEQLWEGHALVKQGIYAYKYVLLEDNAVNDLALDQSFTNSRQEYLTFVYFRDPARRFDRLLQVDRLVAN